MFFIDNFSIRSNTKFCPMRLHSLISAEEQIKVFHRAPAGYRKIILSTNMAESSITVPDVKYGKLNIANIVIHYF